jgi:VanZ family protein
MNETKHRARLWLFAALTLLMMIVIFWFSAQNAVVSQQMSDGFLASLIGRFLDAFLPRLSEKGMQFDIRKYAHMSEFFVLAVCAFLYASEYRRWPRDLRASLLAFGFSLLYACTDEVHQIFVPGRACRFTDVLVDGAGIALGVLLCRLLQRLTQGRAGKART